MTNVFLHLKKFVKSLAKNKLSRLLFLTFAIYFAGALGVFYFEETLSFIDAFWWSIVTITTVGYGDITPATIGGRVTGIIVMVFGIGLLGMFTATIAGAIVEGKMREDKGMKAVKVSDHFIICGWSLKAKEIIEELRADPKVKDKPIVLISDIAEKPFEDDNTFFIHGEVNNETLEKACLKNASEVIILSYGTGDSYSRDAKSVLNILTIKTLKPDIYICVEIEDAKNLEHCKMAGASEVIVIGKLSSNLLVQAALDHGITHLIADLVSNRGGSQIYKIKPGQNLSNKQFIEALTFLKKECNAIALAVESLEEKKFIANPPMDYIIQPDDQLFVVAEERPKFNSKI